ncbi:hypothetical protein E2C01_010749 [Portunus trituberculatus]|uniref:Secreted protein n=1 Tax=Portunus trituberculatus TaxID=210409 RepID=A0A5B7D991_PORTR|nr:hypothetical protein [Portunus trituberculatus]
MIVAVVGVAAAVVVKVVRTGSEDEVRWRKRKKGGRQKRELVSIVSFPWSRGRDSLGWKRDSRYPLVKRDSRATPVTYATMKPHIRGDSFPRFHHYLHLIGWSGIFRRRPIIRFKFP